MAEIWGAAIAAAATVGSAVYSTQQQKKAANKALDAQRGIAADIKYEPIDIEKLKFEATQAAIENATNSLALERQLTPKIADTRAELSRQISDDLKLGGELPPDVANRVTTAGRVIGARSGIGSGSTVPLTASLLGISSLDLANQRRQAASNLLRDNPLPISGLDPGQIASYEVANNAAFNDFNAAKAGVSSKLAESEAAARTAQIGGQVGSVSALSNLIGTGIDRYQQSRAGIGEKISYDDYLKKYGTPKSSVPSYTPVDTSFSFN